MDVKDAMTSPVTTIEPQATMAAAGALMRDANVGCLVVVHEQDVKGMLTDRDIATRFVPINRNPETAIVEDYMTSDPITVMPSTPVMDALDIMKRRKVKRLPVVYAAKLEGIIALVDIAETLEPTTRDLLTGLKESRHNV